MKDILTPEQLAFPFGKAPSAKQLTEFLDRKQGKGKNVEVVRKKILAHLSNKRKQN